MKKIRYVLMLILLFLITGCSEYNMSMKIDKDKSMEYKVSILSNSYNHTLMNNISVYKEKFEQYGYVVEEYNQNDKFGMIITKQFDDIDEISFGDRSEEFDLLYFYNNDYNEEIEKKMFNVEEGFFTNRYAANFYVDLSNLGIDLNDATVTYSVELPNGNFSNNANNTTDGSVLIWNITSLGKTEIDFVFEVISYDKIYYYLAILFAIFLFFLILSKLFTKSDNDKNRDRKIVPVDSKEIKSNKTAVKNTNTSNNNAVNTSKVSNNNQNITNKGASVSVIPPGEVTTNNLESNNNEDLPNPFGTNENNNSSVNVNSDKDNGSILDWYDNSSPKKEISNVNDNDVINVEPILNGNSLESDVNINLVNDNINLNNVNNVSVDNEINQDVNINNATDSIINVNNKSVVVSNVKKEDE